jgi:hypothetical membrane protein
MMNKLRTDVRTLFWLVIFLIVLYVILDAIAQMLPPHYSPISQAESDLAVGKFGFVMAINFLNRGVLSLLFVLAFDRTLKLLKVDRSQFRIGSYLLVVWAVGALLLAVFPTDVPATPISWHGAIHLVFAIIAFIGGAFGTLALSRKLTQNTEFEGLRRVVQPISVIAVLLWLVESAIPFTSPHLNSNIGGLVERLFLGSILLWLAVASAYIATHLPQIARAPGANSAREKHGGSLFIQPILVASSMSRHGANIDLTTS